MAMTLGQMKVVDHLLGGLVCAVLGGLKRLLPARSREAAFPPRTIVALKFLGMGSILQASRTLAALRGRFPGAHIVLLTSRSNTAFARILPDYDEVRCIDVSHPGRLAADLVRQVGALRGVGVDLVLDLEFFSNFTAMLTFLIGPRWSIGFATPKFRNRIYDELVSFDHGRHISDIFFKLARAVGVPAPERLALLRPSPSLPIASMRVDHRREHRALEAVLSARGYQPGLPLIAVNVNAGPLSLNRRWPLEHYRDLLARVLARPHVQVVLVGAPDERAYVATLVEALGPRPRLIDVSGELSIPQLILLLCRADLYLGNDSGPLHIALACGTRTVSFFGPETPLLYGPQGPGHVVFYKELPCSPCLNVYNQKSTECRDNQCMKQITVDEVMARVEGVFSGLEPRGDRAQAHLAKA